MLGERKETELWGRQDAYPQDSRVLDRLRALFQIQFAIACNPNPLITNPQSLIPFSSSLFPWILTGRMPIPQAY